MYRGAIVRDLSRAPGDLLPGSHVVLLGEGPRSGLRPRYLGWEARDTLLVLRPTGPLLAFLFRVPCSEPTVAENVLEHGTGALWIDPCRVSPTGERLGGGSEKRATFEDSEGWSRPWMKNEEHVRAHAEKIQANVERATQLGRWPSNLVLVHGQECRRVGTVSIRGNRTDTRPEGDGGRTSKENWRFRPTDATRRGYSDENGQESVVAWSCIEGCPVAELDGQSGTLTSGMLTPYHARNMPRLGHGGAYSNDEGTQAPREWGGDSGGASRFYPQFESEVQMIEWFRTLLGRTDVFVE